MFLNNKGRRVCSSSLAASMTKATHHNQYVQIKLKGWTRVYLFVRGLQHLVSVVLTALYVPGHVCRFKVLFVKEINFHRQQRGSQRLRGKLSDLCGLTSERDESWFKAQINAIWTSWQKLTDWFFKNLIKVIHFLHSTRVKEQAAIISLF